MYFDVFYFDKVYFVYVSLHHVPTKLFLNLLKRHQLRSTNHVPKVCTKNIIFYLCTPRPNSAHQAVTFNGKYIQTASSSKNGKVYITLRLFPKFLRRRVTGHKTRVQDLVVHSLGSLTTRRQASLLIIIPHHSHSWRFGFHLSADAVLPCLSLRESRFYS